MKINPTIRLSLGLVFLTLSIVIIAQALGLIPDAERSSIQSREQFAETIALQTMLAMKRNDNDQITKLFEAAIQNNQALESIALRKTTGQIIHQTPNHENNWQLPPGENSNAQFIRIPIQLGAETQAILEQAFIPIKQETQYIYGLPHFVVFALFTCASGFIVFWFYIRRILRQLDPNSVVPSRVRNALNIMAEGVLILDRREQIVLANEEICNLLGWPESRLVGRKISDIGWRSENSQTPPPWETAKNSGQKQIKVPMRLKLKDRKEMIFRVNAVPILDANGSSQGIITSFDNISELVAKNYQLKRMLKNLDEQRQSIEAKNKELSFLASSDPLTNCFNRRTLFDYLNDYFSDTTQPKVEMCVIMGDIDHFKSINDNYGHNFGDEAIKFVANVMKTNTREQDMVVRFGGEEFCILLPNTNIESAYEICERCRKLIEGTPLNDVNMTSSFGVASQRFGATNPTELIHLADQALYASKENGRNRTTVWTRDLQEDSTPELKSQK